MLPGPLGLVPLSGRMCTRISYSPRSVVHNLALPDLVPDTPQVTYTPVLSDLPTITGHYPSLSGTEPYRDLWFNCLMVTVKNIGASTKTLTIGYRKYGSTYSTTSVNVGSGYTISWINGNGLTAPDIGVEEAIRLHSANSAGTLFLVKSYFVVAPFKMLKGPLRDIYSMQLISSNESIFGETATGVGSITLSLFNYNGSCYYSTYSGNETFPSTRLYGASDYAINLDRPYGYTSGSNDPSTIYHSQFRYPTAILYSMAMR